MLWTNVKQRNGLVIANGGTTDLVKEKQLRLVSVRYENTAEICFHCNNS
jgi:hypothetical protein